MNHRYHAAALGLGLLISALIVAGPLHAQWSAEPGATVRNEFGPASGDRAGQCRGACGAGCPRTCERTVAYECAGDDRLRRVETFDCGTHQGCRVHDDCLDACLQSGAEDGTCQSRCDTDVMNRFGVEASASWLTGGGPYDGRTRFEYTQDSPGALEPAFRCPDGSSVQCGEAGVCVTEDGRRVEPVFDAYPAASDGAMRISAFRSGPACGERVCEQSADIRVTGGDSCPGGDCTRFGMEFDYTNADPSAPLECSTSTRSSEGDFVGDLLKQGADAMAQRGGGGETASDGSGDGMAELMGLFGKVLNSADSPDDVNVSMAPLGPDGKPIESERVGSQPADGPPPIPREVDLPAASGHLFVPMYQLAQATNPGEVKERRVRCTHQGIPVLETTFRLQSNAR